MRYITAKDARSTEYLVVDTDTGYVKAYCNGRPDAAFIVNALNHYTKELDEAKAEDERMCAESAAEEAA